MDCEISFELGPIYVINYLDGRSIKFQVIGGSKAEIRVIEPKDATENTLPAIIENFKSIEKTDE